MTPSAMPDANGNGTNNTRGLVNLIAQTFAGVKTFLAAVVLSAGLTINGTVQQQVRVTPPVGGGTGFANPSMWFELTGSNQTNLIQFGSGLTGSTWEFALGFYSGALAPLIQSRGNMFLSVASGGYIAPISPGVNDFGASTNYWRHIWTSYVHLNPGGAARPTADASSRGTIWYSKSAGGAADTVEICLKSAADTYSWVTIATG